MKKTLIGFILLLILYSCINHIDEEQIKSKVVFNLGYEVSDIKTRAKLSDSFSKLKLFVYSDNELIEEISQTSDDNYFGLLSLELVRDNYDFYFVGYKSAECAFQKSTESFLFDKVSDTFIYHANIDVSDDTESESISLTRCVCLFELLAEDVIPAGTSKIRVTIENYYDAVNGSSGFAEGDPSELVREISIPSSYIGRSNISFKIYGFAPDDGYKTDISVDILDSENSMISSHQLNNVPLHKNKVTQYSGELFSNTVTTGLNISVDNEWDEILNFDL